MSASSSSRSCSGPDIRRRRFERLDERIAARQVRGRLPAAGELLLDLVAVLAVIGERDSDLARRELVLLRALPLGTEVSEQPDDLPDVEAGPDHPCATAAIISAEGDARKRRMRIASAV